MKIAIAGSRGIPASYGGFETFAEELSTRLREKGEDVTVICENSRAPVAQYKGVHLLYSRYSKAASPVQFYLDSLKIAMKNFDLVLVCGVGGAIFYPLFKRKSVRLITHVDGREELRGKYSAWKKFYVRAAQYFAAHYCNHLVADSFAIMNHWIKRFRLPENKISVIEFGADLEIIPDDSILTELNLQTGTYFLVVCRMVPENNLDVILNGFMQSGSSRKLVLVGNTSGKYGDYLKEISSPQVVFQKSIYDRRKLFSLRKNCYAYIHGHSVGGTNPSLLEAMAAGNLCICHDNEFNRETTAGHMIYFKTKGELARQIIEVEQLNAMQRKEYMKRATERISSYYNWDRITSEYLRLFHSA